MSRIVLYLAGGLFNAGERLHLLHLEDKLRGLGYDTILPQRDATKLFADGKFDAVGTAQTCARYACSPDTLYIGSLDGADADSGGSVEFGIAVTATGRAVVYRTDIRTAEERELGFNAMFRVGETEYVYLPCPFIELEEVDVYYERLAQAIHSAIVRVLGKDLTIAP